MQSDSQRVTFAAPHRSWRWIITALFGLCSVALVILWATTPDLDSGLGITMLVVFLPLWVISLFGSLISTLNWFVQIRQGAYGPVAWMDPEGIHVRDGQTILWPEVGSVFLRRTETKDLLFCIRPTDVNHFLANAPNPRQDQMRSNLDKYDAPLFINLSAFWQKPISELSTKIATFTSGRLSLPTE
ncbi:hypothetical protein BZB76_5599 [Actinomadura pelletieri DSM 43383]|uniref:Uncharacterized protein n=1 Tax=Actinomadura pelletieri DSM 43383 TaxID=1120940 RepID=A0A495QH64_9ACTN|nr:hypothetical protein [Actinomadura pelletieri]RKS71113.1 hypothetical protein BZB76_5599 [Actinomadura pelletieri DSM 43383]